MTAVGLAVLEALTDPVFEKRRDGVAAGLREGLEQLGRRHGCLGVRGSGFLLALRLPKPVGPDVVSACFERGLLVNAPGPGLIRLMPALTVSGGEVAAMLEILSASLEEALEDARAGSRCSLAPITWGTLR